MENMRYKEFVSNVLEPLSNDEIRRDKQKVKQLLINYFKKEQFAVYSFVHYYFNKKNKKSELNCTKEIVKEVLNDLISGYENCDCKKNNNKGKYGDKIVGSCENVNCINRKFVNETDSAVLFQCEFRERYYHVIRRIAKFYENLHSVDNLTKVNKSIEITYSDIANSIKDDVNQFRAEALEQSKNDLNEIQKKVRKTNKKLNEMEKKLVEITVRSAKISSQMENNKQDILINIISVLSIFSAVLLATIVPMNLLNAISKQIFIYNWEIAITPILIFTLILFVMFNLIYFLISYVATIALGERCNVLFASKRKLVFRINAILLLFISVLFLCVVCSKIFR